jgi:hypothetical protein
MGNKYIILTTTTTTTTTHGIIVRLLESRNTCNYTNI